MKEKQKFLNIILLALIIIIQYVFAIVCVFCFPGLGISFLKLTPPDYPLLSHLSLLAAFSIGIFLIGWLGLVLIRRQVKKQFFMRLTLTVLATVIPLSIGLIPGLESDGIFYFIAILAGIVGFYLPEVKLLSK